MPKSLLRVVYVVVRDGCVRRHAVIPQRHGALLPLDAHLEVLALSNVLLGRNMISLRLFPDADFEKGAKTTQEERVIDRAMN